MIIGNSVIQQIVSKVVSHAPLSAAAQDPYSSAMAGASSPVASLIGNDDDAAQDSTDAKQGYNESFAKMMVNLKAALGNTTEAVTDDAKAAAAAAFSSISDKQLAATDSVTKTVDSQLAAVNGTEGGASSGSSVRDQFMQYMNQSDAEKVRQQLTGVSKAEYASMTPQQQAAVDNKVAELQKHQQVRQVAEQDVKTRIAMAKAEMA